MVDGYAVISHNTTNVIMYEGDSGSYSAYTETLPDYVLLNDVSNLSDLINSINVLYAKKYVALADSFSHGIFIFSKQLIIQLNHEHTQVNIKFIHF